MNVYGSVPVVYKFTQIYRIALKFRGSLISRIWNHARKISMKNLSPHAHRPHNVTYMHAGLRPWLCWSNSSVRMHSMWGARLQAVGSTRSARQRGMSPKCHVACLRIRENISMKFSKNSNLRKFRPVKFKNTRLSHRYVPGCIRENE